MESPAPVAPDAEVEGPAGRGLRRLGLVLLLLASLLPYHGCIAHPREFAHPPSTKNGYSRDNAPYRPIAAVEYFLRRDLLRDESVDQQRLWTIRGDWDSDDYGYAIFFGVVPWLLVLGLARRRGSRTRKVTGVATWVASAALPPTLALVLHYETRFDWWIAILLGALSALPLLARPPGRRRPEDIEATFATHAGLGMGFALARPAIDAWNWIVNDGHSPNAVLLAFLHNYRPGFYVTMAALGLVAAPLYFSEDALRPLYDRLRPWRSRSSTRTPTSTSRSSTGTASRSSSAPAPPASSPS